VRFLNARGASFVVPAPVVPTWYDGLLCGVPVVQRVVRTPVLLFARYGQRDRVLRVIQMNARCAGRDAKWA
jgi:hypothetical protein